MKNPRPEPSKQERMAAKKPEFQAIALEKLASEEPLSALEWLAVQEFIMSHQSVNWGMQKELREKLAETKYAATPHTIRQVVSGRCAPSTNKRKAILRAALSITIIRAGLV